MALTNPFDTSTPAGSDDPKAGDDRIRELKDALVEREGQDHYWPASGTVYDDDDCGFHSKVTLLEQGSAPASKANAGRLYTKDDGGDTELYYKDDSGNEIQVTEDGALKSTSVFVTGDLLLSSVTTAHSGWTNVTATYASKHIRVGNTALGTGGSATLSGSSGSTTLTAAQSGSPAHTHEILAKSGGALGSTADWTTHSDTAAQQLDITTQASVAVNAASGHTHSLTSVANTPLYVDVRMFKKD